MLVREDMLNPETAAYVGTAGWSIPAQSAGAFPSEGTHLNRYAQRLRCAEINSSFYRPHRPATYARWAASTPDGFLFSVKAPKTITHEGKLAVAPELLDTFLGQIASLGDKLGPLLFQLPPKLAFNASRADDFFAHLRTVYPAGPVVLEPRHASWFTAEAASLLCRHAIGRVLADPTPVPQALEVAGDLTTRYYRLHGSPRIYYSAYEGAYLDDLAATLGRLPEEVMEAWVIFDNTAAGAALQNALDLKARISI